LAMRSMALPCISSTVRQQSIIASEVRGDAGLNGRIRGRPQVAELIDEAGEGAASFVRRQAVLHLEKGRVEILDKRARRSRSR